MEGEMDRDEETNIFFDLPSHIAIDILTRLSTKTISRCCCVCKQWLALVLSPEFANLRQSRTPAAYLMFYTNHTVPLLSAVELEDEPTSHEMYYLPGSTLTEFIQGSSPYSMSMFGSINGLLCFHEFGYHSPDRVLLLNPVTLERIILPSPGGLMEYPNITSHGFGVSSVSSLYKVVRIYQEAVVDGEARRITKSECHVYTLGQGCWRLLQEQAPFMYSFRSNGVFFNGYIHWLIQDPNGTETISCFDLEKESFSPFPAPPELDQRDLATLGVYKDCFLNLCDNTSDFEITIWVMEEYGVKESWVKKFVIDKEAWGMAGEPYEVVRVLKVFRDGVILLLSRDDALFSYNPETNYLEHIDVQNLARMHEKYPCIDVVDYVPSFLSQERWARS